MSNVTLDFSDGCGGVFFDRSEMMRFEGSEQDGEYLSELMAAHHDLALDYSQRVRCPNDPDFVMVRRYYSPKRGVQIDECPKCGGCWLDGDELETARYEVPDDAERRRMAKDFAAEVLRSSPVAQYEMEQLATMSKLSEIRRALVWLLYTAFRY